MPSALEMSRKHTLMFIADDPTTMVLVPQVKVGKPGGGYTFISGTPRPPQDFKVIFQSGSTDGKVASEAGSIRKYEFVVVGPYNAEIEIGDVWTDDNGDKWVVQGFAPYNSYETKANFVAFSGGKPQHG